MSSTTLWNYRILWQSVIVTLLAGPNTVTITGKHCTMSHLVRGFPLDHYSVNGVMTESLCALRDRDKFEQCQLFNSEQLSHRAPNLTFSKAGRSIRRESGGNTKGGRAHHKRPHRSSCLDRIPGRVILRAGNFSGSLLYFRGRWCPFSRKPFAQLSSWEDLQMFALLHFRDWRGQTKSITIPAFTFRAVTCSRCEKSQKWTDAITMSHLVRGFLLDP